MERDDMERDDMEGCWYVKKNKTPIFDYRGFW